MNGQGVGSTVTSRLTHIALATAVALSLLPGIPLVSADYQEASAEVAASAASSTSSLLMIEVAKLSTSATQENDKV